MSTGDPGSPRSSSGEEKAADKDCGLEMDDKSGSNDYASGHPDGSSTTAGPNEVPNIHSLSIEDTLNEQPSPLPPINTLPANTPSFRVQGKLFDELRNRVSPNDCEGHSLMRMLEVARYDVQQAADFFDLWINELGAPQSNTDTNASLHEEIEANEPFGPKPQSRGVPPPEHRPRPYPGTDEPPDPELVKALAQSLKDYEGEVRRRAKGEARKGTRSNHCQSRCRSVTDNG